MSRIIKLVHIEQIDDFLYRVAFSNAARGVFDMRKIKELSSEHEAMLRSKHESFSFESGSLVWSPSVDVSSEWVYANSDMSEPNGIASYIATLIDILDVEPKELAGAIGLKESELKSLSATSTEEYLPYIKLLVLLMENPASYATLESTNTQSLQTWCNSEASSVC